MRPRVIPILLIHQSGVINTTRFKGKTYIGDPVNTAKLYNELEVDELVILDFDASKQGNKPDFALLDDLRQQCFFPLSYGGGISSVKDAETIIRLGFEKVVLNTLLHKDKTTYAAIVDAIGAQSVCVSLDVKKNWRGQYKVYNHAQSRRTSVSPQAFLSEVMALTTPGEIMLTSVDHEGMRKGYDLQLLDDLVKLFPHVPIVMNGGAAKLEDIKLAIEHGAHAAAGTTCFVEKNGGILVNYPYQQKLNELFNT